MCWKGLIFSEWGKDILPFFEKWVQMRCISSIAVFLTFFVVSKYSMFVVVFRPFFLCWHGPFRCGNGKAHFSPFSLVQWKRASFSCFFVYHLVLHLILRIVSFFELLGNFLDRQVSLLANRKVPFEWVVLDYQDCKWTAQCVHVLNAQAWTMNSFKIITLQLEAPTRDTSVNIFFFLVSAWPLHNP